MSPDLPDGLAGHAVLMRTGWDGRRGTARYWEPAPYVDRRLAAERAGIPIVEHLRGLTGLPASGFRFSAVPAPIRGAASMPVRAFVELPERGGI